MSQPSYGNKWFPQVPQTEDNKTEKPAEPKQQPKQKEIPNPNQGTARTLYVKQACDTFAKMTETITKYKEELLFHGTGLTFGAQNIPYSGGMMFFTNQEKN